MKLLKNIANFEFDFYMKKLLFVILLALSINQLDAQFIENVSYDFVNEKIEINYDLKGSTGQIFFVNIYYHYGDSSKMRVLEYAEGDIGINISLGKNKKVVWDYIEDIYSIKDSLHFFIDAKPENFNITPVEKEIVQNTTMDNQFYYVVAYQAFIGGRLGFMYNHWGVNANVGTDVSLKGMFFYGSVSYRFYNSDAVSIGAYPLLGYNLINSEMILGVGTDFKLIENAYLNFDLGFGNNSRKPFFTVGIGVVL